MISWTDAHTHLDSGELYTAKEAVLSRAAEAGVNRLLLVNSDATQESMQRTMECGQLESPVKRFISFGIHPHQAEMYNPVLERTLLDFLQLPGVIGFGEIGLDFYYNHSSRDAQIRVLKRQLALALERNLPVVIHCRDAYPDLADLLRAESNHWHGMIHCFTGNAEQSELFLDLGFHISFSGIVTFRNADELRHAALLVPPDRILVETDAPFLAPTPFRGRTNEPSYVVHTGQLLAQLRSVTPEDFARQTNQNFEQLFSLH